LITEHACRCDILMAYLELIFSWLGFEVAIVIYSG
jgi:hypothetical protein